MVFVGLSAWSTGQYAITPGDATSVTPLVSVRGVSTNPHPDTIMLTDVYLTALNGWQWITMHFSSHVQFLPGSALVPPGVSTSELNNQGYLEMRDAKLAAEVEAFRTLGWSVGATPAGTIVNGVVTHSPASKAGLVVGDNVVGFDHRPVRTSCQLVRDVHLIAPGTAVRLLVRRVSFSSAGVLSWRRATEITLMTGRPLNGAAVGGCAGVSGPDHSWLGVSLEDNFRYALPARVSIDTASIGGPSAGLAMTLALINDLSHGSLTGHHIIAATGTMSVGGAVGDVGGVAEKTVAVQRAGARYFIVPQVEVATARTAASPGLTVLGVTTLHQALADLRAIGGVVPRPLSPVP